MNTNYLSWRRLVLPIRLGIDPMEKLLYLMLAIITLLLGKLFRRREDDWLNMEAPFRGFLIAHGKS